MNELQLGLFEPIGPVVTRRNTRPLTIQERFEEFHQDNPHIYARLRDLCLQMRRRGVVRWGIKAAWEVVRFGGVLSNGQDGFKLPNSLTSRYARKLMTEVPELRDFFETRDLRSK